MVTMKNVKREYLGHPYTPCGMSNGTGINEHSQDRSEHKIQERENSASTKIFIKIGKNLFLLRLSSIKNTRVSNSFWDRKFILVVTVTSIMLTFMRSTLENYRNLVISRKKKMIK